jgi:hypothetical protein
MRTVKKFVKTVLLLAILFGAVIATAIVTASYNLSHN